MTAGEFWQWFVSNEGRLWRLDDQALDEIQNALMSHREGLSVEVSDEERGRRDLIISAEGDSGLFETVESLVSAAPTLRRWRVMALKPERGFDFVLDVGQTRLHPADLLFEPLTTASDPEALGVRVFVPVASVGDDVVEAVRRVIETGLGERVAATALAHLEVRSMPTDASEYIPLSDLGKYIGWFAKKVGQRN